MKEEIERLNKFYNKYFKKYEEIIDVIKENTTQAGLSYISQKDIASRLNISQSLVSKCIIRLERSDKCIEKIKRNTYKVNHNDLKKYGPYTRFLKYYIAVLKHDEFLNFSWEEKSRILGFSKDEVIMANGYFIDYLHWN